MRLGKRKELKERSIFRWRIRIISNHHLQHHTRGDHPRYRHLLSAPNLQSRRLALLLPFTHSLDTPEDGGWGDVPSRTWSIPAAASDSCCSTSVSCCPARWGLSIQWWQWRIVQMMWYVSHSVKFRWAFGAASFRESIGFAEWRCSILRSACLLLYISSLKRFLCILKQIGVNTKNSEIVQCEWKVVSVEPRGG